MLIIMAIWTALNAWDTSVILFIHEHLHSSFGNMVIPPLRKALFWLPLYLFLIGKFVVWWGRRFWIPLVFLLCTVGVADFVSVHLFKNPVGRLRPCHTLQDDPRFELLVNCGGQYSFVSSHATNHMAIAIFFMGLFAVSSPGRRYWWIVWAMVIGFAQVYVGVHYPLDVLAGFVLGGLIGFVGQYLLRRFFPEFFAFQPVNNSRT